MSAVRWLRRWGLYVLLSAVFTFNGAGAGYSLGNGNNFEAAISMIVAATTVAWLVALWFSDRTSATTRNLLLEVETDLALVDAARRTVIMPEFDVGPDGVLRGVSFPPVTIPTGESANWAIPRIRGWPTMDLIVRRADQKDRGESLMFRDPDADESARVRVNWEEGTVDIFDAGGLKDFTIEVSREGPLP